MIFVTANSCPQRGRGISFTLYQSLRSNQSANVVGYRLDDRQSASLRCAANRDG